MTCEACRAAALDPLSAIYQADCRGCQARSIARSPQFFAAKRAGGKAGPAVWAYRELLERFGVSHSEVMEVVNGHGAPIEARQHQGEPHV